MRARARRTFWLGDLAASGGAFSFKPASAREFEADAGEEVKLAVLYSYEEASYRRESCHVEFTVELDGVERGSAEARLRDRPLLRDEELGCLFHATRIDRSGPVRGRWRLRATYTERGWLGGRPEVVDFEDGGEFVLRVR